MSKLIKNRYETTYKYLITDEEYDKLNWHEQMRYKWCEKCQVFYDTKQSNNCVCKLFEGGVL